MELLSISGQDADRLERVFQLPYFRRNDEALRAYIRYAEMSKEVAVLVVYGEVGTGKTTTLRKLKKLAESRGHLAVLLNAFDFLRELRGAVSSGTPIAPATVESLLRVSLSGLGIPWPGGVKSAMKELLSRSRTGKIFILIDEFEDVVGYGKDVVVAALKGIASLVNGEYAPLSSSGEFAGSIHIAFSMTPSAAYRLASYEEFYDIVGRERRRESFRIRLRNLNRRESILLCFTYLRESGTEGRIHPLFFDAIYRASRGNPGYLVLMLNKLVSLLETADAEKAEPEHIWNALCDVEIDEYGVKTRGLGRERLDELRELLGRNLNPTERMVLGLLLTCPYPITLEDISDVLGVGISEAEEAISAVDRELKARMGKGLNRYSTVPLSKFVNSLKEIPAGVSKLLDEALIYRGRLGNLRVSVAVPLDEEAMKELAERAEISANKLRDIFGALPAGGSAFRMPREVIDSVFPPPCPICVAAEDSGRASEEWREALRDVTLGQANPLELGMAALQLLVDEIPDAEDRVREGNVVVKTVEVGGKMYRIRMAALGLLRSEQMTSEYIHKVIGTYPPLVIIFTKPELEGQARRVAERLRHSYVKLVSLSSVDMAILLGLYRMRGSLIAQKRDEVLSAVRERAGIRPREFFDRALIEMRDRGFVLELPPWDPKTPISDIPKIYDYFLACPRRYFTPEEAYSYVTSRIKGLKPFGVRIRGFIAARDIESAGKLSDYVPRLVEIGMLRRVGEKISVENSPIEERLIAIIKGKVDIEKLTRYFAIPSKSEALDALRSVYLETLSRKGYVSRDRTEVSYIGLWSLRSEATRVLARIDRMLSRLKGGFDVLLFTKQRDFRTIRVGDVAGAVRELIEAADRQEREVDKRRLLETALRLGTIMLEVYIQLASWAHEDYQKVLRDSRDSVDVLKNSVIKLRSALSGLGLELDPVPLELKEARRKLSELEEIQTEELDEATIERILNEAGSAFSFVSRFDKLKDRDEMRRHYYFSPRLFLAVRKKKELDDLVLRALSLVEKIEERAESLRWMLNEVAKASELIKKLAGESVELVVSGAEKVRCDSLSELLSAISAIKPSSKGTSEIARMTKALEFLLSKREDIFQLLRESEWLMKEIEKGNLSEEHRDKLSVRDGIARILSGLRKMRGEVSLKELEELLSPSPNLPEDVAALRSSIERAKEELRRREARISRSISLLREKLEEAGVAESLAERLRGLERAFSERRNWIAVERELEEIEREFRKRYASEMDPVIGALLERLAVGGSISLVKLVKEISEETGVSREEVAKRVALKLLEMQEKGEVMVTVRRV